MFFQLTLDLTYSNFVIYICFEQNKWPNVDNGGKNKTFV